MSTEQILDMLSHAASAKLVAAIMEDADEATIKTAVGAFPAIVLQILEEALQLAGKG